MANRYWVGGSGNWSDTAHWSTTSGGSGGASVPTSTDNVYFNASSFSSNWQTVTLTASATCYNLIMTGVAYNFTLATGAYLLSANGDTITLNSYLTLTSSYSNEGLTIRSAVDCNLTINGAAIKALVIEHITDTSKATYLQDDLTLSTGYLEINAGHFYSNNHTLNVFGIRRTSSTYVATLHLGSSSVTAGKFYITESSGLSFDAGTSSITLTSTDTQYFSGFTYYNLTLQQSVTFVDAFTCNNLTLTAGKTYTFLADSTYKVTTLLGSGSSASGNIVVKSTTSGTRSKIELTNQAIRSWYDIKDINFTSKSLVLTYSIDGGNNLNVIFKLIIDDLYTYTQPLQYRITLKKTDGSKITMLPEAFNIEYTASLKDTDTFSFTLPFEVDGNINENLTKIHTDYIVFVEMYSPETETIFMNQNFLITKIENKQDGNKYIKNIECSSLEVQLNRKLLEDYTGTKVIYRTQTEIDSWTTSETYPTRAKFIESGILNVICQLNPSWSVDESEIDEDIASLARYIDIDSENCLYFLLNTVQTSFMCILFFDTITKKISVRNLTHLGTDRGFFLSNHNIIMSHTQEINSEDVITRYTLYGKDELTIRSVNPTGEVYVLDLSYYRNSKYMSQSLLDALTAYDALIATKTTQFNTLLTQLNTYTTTLSTQKSALELLESELKVLNIELNTLMATNSSLTAKKAQITAKETEITNKKAEITTSNTNITNTNNSIETLQTSILISNNFTTAQIEELDPFIKDKNSTDDTITTASELYEEAKTLIAKINQPSINFDIDIVDLFNVVELQTEWQKISLGDIGSIRHDAFDDEVVQLRLIGYTHNYTDNQLTLSFGNRNNLNAESMLLEDLKTTISNTTTLDIQKYKTLDYYENDKSQIQSYISDVLKLGAQGATAGSNNEVTIDGKGITLSNPSDAQKMVRLMYNGIYLTTDGFQTAKWALTANGINAEVVRGILGQFCTVKCDRIIINDDGTGFSDIGIKMTHANGSYTNLTSAGLLRYVATPTYSTTSTGLSVSEDFTTNNTIALLQAAGWDFGGGNVSVSSNKLVLGTTSTTKVRNYGRVSKYITKSDSSFSFTYNTGSADDHAYFYILIDNNRYELSRSATNVTWSAAANSITISEGMHTFEWYQSCTWNVSAASPVSPIIYIDNIVFETNTVTKTQTGTTTTGKNYNYLTATGSGTTGANIWGSDSGAIPYVWVQLPDEFKGKTFTFNIFVADSGDTGQTYAITRINVYAEYIDYTNARIKVRAIAGNIAFGYNTTIGNYTVNFFRGCDFAWIAIL